MIESHHHPANSPHLVQREPQLTKPVRSVTGEVLSLGFASAIPDATVQKFKNNFLKVKNFTETKDGFFNSKKFCKKESDDYRCALF